MFLFGHMNRCAIFWQNHLLILAGLQFGNAVFQPIFAFRADDSNLEAVSKGISDANADSKPCKTSRSLKDDNPLDIRKILLLCPFNSSLIVIWIVVTVPGGLAIFYIQAF